MQLLPGFRFGVGLLLFYFLFQSESSFHLNRPIKKGSEENKNDKIPDPCVQIGLSQSPRENETLI